MEVDMVNARELFDEPGPENGWYHEFYEWGANVEVGYVGSCAEGAAV